MLQNSILLRIFYETFILNDTLGSIIIRHRKFEAVIRSYNFDYGMKLSLNQIKEVFKELTNYLILISPCKSE